MNSILGMLHLLEDAKLDKTEEQYMHIAKSAADTLLGLINNMLGFSTIEAGKIKLEKIRIELWELVNDVVASFADTAKTKNIIGNAIKFTTQGEVVLR